MNADVDQDGRIGRAGEAQDVPQGVVDQPPEDVPQRVVDQPECEQEIVGQSQRHQLERGNRGLGVTARYNTAWWRNGSASDLRSRGRKFDPRPVRGCVTTLGKLFTPNCLDADSLRYHMESINRVPVLFITRLLFRSRNTRLFISVSDLHSEVFVRSDFRFLTLGTALGVTA